MNVFDIIGPVMIGPSSSHTAGAVRLGRVANKVLNQEEPKDIMVELSGSFATTYKGHGTDKALLAGIMGYHSYSEEIRDIFNIADKRGITYKFVPTEIPNSHPNTARIHVTGVKGTPVTVQGASIGGGNIRVDYINGMKVDFNGEHNTILVPHYDRPGCIAEVTNIMWQKYKKVNIGNFKLSRPVKGGVAMMTIEIDGMPPEGMIEDIRTVKNVLNVFLIRAI
ncbi:MAG: L-serine ammonia-lyase, iron-sulfur-dependent subunit beta [Acidaminococcus sp.]|jgi:L-serine dehydratase|nr:L-serine ammonia-lyase, iron-sulfur-dependent subunit beta [Acidaminococcus sp.]MCI2099549.1 L-serine ammonia-lyase, iron-sulfur-dependent subunit beta [Acidaminococcus sp.]MCI2113634.1 L-serine ammonia-lyase, iron-sulfur-dependent subunit beta [Acidaminococcus sp.]MCI2115717.1 L-serine ammonia-lyase, iron-sulfur-dependent subunit beta [Acidaminococcus sp.]